MTIDQIETILPNLKNSSSLAQYEKLYDLIQAKNNLKEKYINYETAMSQSIEAKANLDTKEKEYITKYSEFTSGKRDFEVAEKELLDKKKNIKTRLTFIKEKR